MKFLGYICIVSSLSGLVLAGLHTIVHMPLMPSPPWLNWFGRLPLPINPFDKRAVFLPAACALLFAIGLWHVSPSKKSSDQQDHEA